MKKAAFLIVIYIAFCCQAFSQDSSEFATDCPTMVSNGGMIGIQGDFTMNSTALTNELYNAFIWKKHIDNDLKDRIDKNLKERNLFGGDFNYEIFYYGKNSKPQNTATGDCGIGYYVKLANKQHFDASFSRDLFNIAFRGNAGYAGNTAYLGQTQFQLLSYQQATIGIYTQEMKLGISLLNGLSHLRGSLDRTDLYTSPTGEFIDLDLNMDLAVSDTSKNSSIPSRGIGVSTELHYNEIIEFHINLGSKSDSNKSNLGFWGEVNFEISDLGFIRWNENTINYQSDTSFHFEGIVLNNLLSVTDSTINQIQDSLNNTYSPSSAKHPYIGVLPAFFHLYTRLYNEAISLRMGTKMRLMANYSPYVYLTFEKTKTYVRHNSWPYNSSLPRNLSVRSTVAFGGYGKFNWGVDFSYNTMNHLYLTIGTQNILGFFLPKSTYGSGLYMMIAKQL